MQIVSADGKIMWQLKQSSFLPGVNKIFVSSELNLNAIVHLNIISKNGKQSIPLHIEK